MTFLARRDRYFLAALAIGALSTGPAAAQDPIRWTRASAETDASLRGLCVVDPRIAWASGTKGQVLLTEDGGSSWRVCVVSGSETTDFRDVEAFDAQTACLLAAGSPARILRTIDGGKTFKEVYRHDDADAFFDAMEFWDERRGIAMSDPVNGRLLIVRTMDGGRTWTPIAAEGIPPALPGEAGFAASGTCIALAENGAAWIALGGQTQTRARVFRSVDWGVTWSASVTTIASGASAGIFSLAFFGPNDGIAVGGDYLKPDSDTSNVSVTADGGLTWSHAAGQPPNGYRSVVRTVPGRAAAAVACGPTGADLTTDGGHSWTPVGNTGFHSLDFAANGAGLAVGADGRISSLRFR